MDLLEWCAGQQAVFIGGCPRSGTTWLEQLLLAHPGTFGPGREAHLPSLCGPILADPAERGLASPAVRAAVLGFYDQQADRPMGPHNLVERDELVEIIDEIADAIDEPAGQVRVLVASLLATYATDHAPDPAAVLVEKTPQNLDLGPLLFGLLERARMVILVRDGRDVAVSMDHYRSAMPQDRREQFTLWAAAVRRGRELLARYPDRCLELRYEDLQRDPAAGLTAVLALAGLDAAPAVVAACVERCHIEAVDRRGSGSHVRAGRVGDWRTHLGSEDLRLFHEIAGPEAEAVGYRES